MVDKPEAYQWSSYRYYVGKGKTPDWLHRTLVHGYFGEKESIAQKRYQRFATTLVGQQYEGPLKDVVGSTLLGDADFVSYIEETFLSDKKQDKDLPALKELTPKASVDDIFSAADDDSLGSDTKLARNVKMYLCQEYTAKKLTDLRRHFGIGESGVSQASRRVSQRMAKDINLRREIEKLETRIKLSRMKT